MPVSMGEYDKKPAKASATSGAAERDRGSGEGKVANHLEARIIKYDFAGGSLVITIASGTEHGTRAGLGAYLKIGADGYVPFQILEANGARSTAIVPDATTEDLANVPMVVINPRSYPPQPAGSIPARCLSVAVIPQGTLITISKGLAHGIVVGTQGSLVSAAGRGSFSVARSVLSRSFAVVHEPRDFVEANQNLTLDRLSPKGRGGGGAAVQRRANGAPVQTADVQATAQAGVAGASSPLPFLDVIQRSFGKHDVSHVRAQIGGPAADASRALGARAYATGNTVAFASAPDLHTAAHEAAHVVQQARGAVGFQGLGAADDGHERHADAVADAVVAGQPAEPILDQLAGGSRSAAVQRKVFEEPSHKERSWIRPSVRLSQTPVHVGAIFFRTRETAIDEQDTALFSELATAYAPYAKRNVGRPHADLGIQGSIVGYADPRRAHEPNNRALSERRASTVATGLERKLVEATRLDIGLVHLGRVGAGIDEAAPEASELAEGNTLAPYRRADIFLNGAAGLSAPRTDEVVAPAPAKDKFASSRLRAAPPLTLEHDRWLPQILAGDKKIIEGISARIAIDLGPNSMTGGRSGLAQLGSWFTPEQPPWWNGRLAQFADRLNPPSQGRSAVKNAEAATRARLVHDTLLLLRDYKEIHYYEETFLHEASEALSNPDSVEPARLEECRRALRYMLFMYTETEKLAWKVHHATE